jgi:hypothetical protein
MNLFHLTHSPDDLETAEIEYAIARKLALPNDEASIAVLDHARQAYQSAYERHCLTTDQKEKAK